MTKSFKARLAALEADAEQQRHAQEANGIPDVATMDDDEVLQRAMWAMRAYHVLDGRGGLVRRVCLSVTLYRDAQWQAYYEALVRRAQVLIDAGPLPFIALRFWEASDAIAAIDAGRCDVVPGWVPAVAGLRGSFYTLRLDGNTHADEDLDYTIMGVNHAVALWAWQTGLPQVGPWEMTELAEYRAWLVARLMHAAL